MDTLQSSRVVGPGYRSNYDRRPTVAVPDSEGQAVCGWEAIRLRLGEHTGSGVLVVDCYVGVFEKELMSNLAADGFDTVVHTGALMKPTEAIDRLVADDLGGDDPVFGYMTRLELLAFFDIEKLREAKQELARRKGGGLVVGVGASLVHTGDVLVLADMPRWEGQQRQRRAEVSNLGAANRTQKASLQYKRSYFVDWRVCDRHKKPLLSRADYFLDSTVPGEPTLAEGNAVRRGLKHCTTRPFRVVPFFDPGPWGGQWMRRVCGLDGYREPEPANYAWCFDCVPEENSLVLDVGGVEVELPSVNLVYLHPRELLGDPVHARFGDEFPIRFDMLDTMGGGNLSLQVHPLTEYIREHFGMTYTQDESYYILDAGEGGCVYLGWRDDIVPGAAIDELKAAQAGGEHFDVGRHVACWPARRHDHFLIPAGTVHCSGRNTMVLEISATPYIFTFKLWDWGRMGLDNLPRPIHLDRGLANMQWDRTAGWVQGELISEARPMDADADGRVDDTGLHAREFIETQRHWFRGPTRHATGGLRQGSVHVLNLVEGDAAVVSSPVNAFEPFEVHYAESFIVPAAVGAYQVTPNASGQQCVVVRAAVRTGLGAGSDGLFE